MVNERKILKKKITAAVSEFYSNTGLRPTAITITPGYHRGQEVCLKVKIEAEV